MHDNKPYELRYIARGFSIREGDLCAPDLPSFFAEVQTAWLASEKTAYRSMKSFIFANTPVEMQAGFRVATGESWTECHGRSNRQ